MNVGLLSRAKIGAYYIMKLSYFENQLCSVCNKNCTYEYN